MSLLDYIGKNQDVKSEWLRIVKNMRPHTQGITPVELYQHRQPNEMADPSASMYRINNHRAITKSPFDIAIARDLNAAQKVDVVEELPELTQDAINKIRLTDGYQNVSLKDWVINFCGRYRQTDPNAVVVVLPKHPETPLIPSYEAEIPDFDSVTNQVIDVMVWLVPVEDIEYISDEKILFKAGQWEINGEGKKSSYYYGIEIDEMGGGQVSLIYPVYDASDRSVRLIEQPYYAIDHNVLPAFVLGGKLQLLIDDSGETVQYYTPDYWGAAEWGNQALCQMSDLQICEKRFTYPEKVVVAKECESTGSYFDNYGRHMMLTEDGQERLCIRCGGKGHIVDTSPLGVHIVRKGSGMNDEGDIQDPVKFITPDVTILEHSANRTHDYYDKMLSELFVTKQNMTNQSGESKSWDAQQRIQNTESIVKDIYRLYRNIVEAIAVYVGEDPMDVVITLPNDLDVSDANDALMDLAEAKKAGVSYPIIVEKTKRHLLKMLGDTPENEFIVNYLAKKDKLFGYSPDEIVKAIATFGSEITSRDRAIHFFGFQLLKDILMQNPEIELTDATIQPLFDSALLAYISQQPILG